MDQIQGFSVIQSRYMDSFMQRLVANVL